jgi:hypothetical protein
LRRWFTGPAWKANVPLQIPGPDPVSRLRAVSPTKARYPMRAEMEAIVDEIKQAISLLRRHL